AGVDRRHDDGRELDLRGRLLRDRGVSEQADDAQQHRQHDDRDAVPDGEVADSHEYVMTGLREGGGDVRGHVFTQSRTSRNQRFAARSSAGRASTTRTRSPSVTVLWPVAMTRAPSSRPAVTTTEPPEVGPSSTGCRAATRAPAAEVSSRTT